MYRSKIAGLLLLILLNPVSCKDLSLTHPAICYILDGFLIFYCIIVTTLFFREKVCRPGTKAMGPEHTGGIYQELHRPKNTDPYEELQPSKRRKKRRKRPEAAVQSDRGAGPEPGAAPPLLPP